MAALIIESNNPKNLELLAELAKKMGDRARPIHTEDVEELVFAQMLAEEKTGNYVTKSEVFKKLGL